MSDKSVNSKAAQQRLKVRRVIPIPEPDEVTKPYWDAARHHQLVVAQCASCHTLRHPPTPDCSACGETNINWTPLNGDGHVYSFIIDRRLMVPGFDEPYILATVIPDEAPSDTLRIVANIKECDIAAVYISMPVEVFFEAGRRDVAAVQTTSQLGYDVRAGQLKFLTIWMDFLI